MISFRVRKLEEVQRFLQSVPNGVKKAALEAMTIFFIGDESHGLRHADPYKYVTREEAYGQSFSSERQRRKVMAMIAEGKITPGTENRTGKSAAGYMYTETNDGYTIQNAEAGAYYTQDERGQARQPALVGWRKMIENMQSNMAGAIMVGREAVARWIKEHNG